MIKESILDCLKKLSSINTVWVACSGGLDSMVLLDAAIDLYQQKSIPSLKIIHVNHGISEHALSWERSVVEYSHQRGLVCEVRRLDLKEPYGGSLEALARQERYAAFKALMQPQDVLLTAHHENDQAETVLLRLLRGSGVKGLAGIRPINYFGRGWLARPLLACSREDLENYARSNAIHWVEDESNTSLDFSRNYLRHEVTPLLLKRWPTGLKKIAESALFLQEADELMNDLARVDLSSFHRGIELPMSLPVVSLTVLPLARLKNLLRYWVHGLGAFLPSKKMLLIIIDEVIYAGPDAHPRVQFGGVEVYRDKRHLFLNLIEKPCSIEVNKNRLK